jgi:hypothetical protein
VADDISGLPQGYLGSLSGDIPERYAIRVSPSPSIGLGPLDVLIENFRAAVGSISVCIELRFVEHDPVGAAWT